MNTHSNIPANLYKDEFLGSINYEEGAKKGLIPSRFKGPVFALLDLTYKCTNKCIYCYNSSGAHTRYIELGDEKMLDIARQLIDLEVVNVCLSGGEPLVRKNLFFDIAKLLHENGVLVSMVSNGWSINEEIAIKLSEYVSTIQLSIDGATAETHDYLRGRKGSFNRVINAIKMIGNTKLCNCSVSFVPNAYNINEYDQLVDLLISLGNVKSLRTQPMVETGRGNSQRYIQLSKEQLNTFIKKIVKRNSEVSRNIKLEYGDPKFFIFQMLKGNMPTMMLQIMANGKLKISPYLPIVAGDLQNDRLKECWEANIANVWQDKKVKRYLSNFKDVNDTGIVAIPWTDNDIMFTDL